MYCIVNTINTLSLKKSNKLISLNIINFKKDMFKKNRCNISEIIDINLTNKKLLENNINIILNDDNNKFTFVKPVMFPLQNEKIINLIIFHNELCLISKMLKPINDYYCIHFRLDYD